MAGDTFTVDALYSATVYDHDGDRIGKVEDVYLDNATSQPEWVSVKTGLFGSSTSLIPLERASLSGEHLTVPFEKAKVKDAPHHDPGHELTETDEDDLCRYYGIASSGGSVTGTTGTGTTGRTETAGTTGMTDRTDTVGHDTSGPNTDDAMTRSKEELRVGTETREAGRARLRKHIVSERVSRTVPVSHE
ncbi:PRC-barrel domain-containing protein, partial [Kineococcus sp. SYSU DK006]|uniref:PRC-barrel domain-containing protein n=1 Tax=Kineococcus sp. SYSU DK006 TaxID=3383127 RepID=UPI003D7E3254